MEDLLVHLVITIKNFLINEFRGKVFIEILSLRIIN